jgi:MFS family permease
MDSVFSAWIRKLPIDFWRFWAGQTVSNFGSSITLFAFPLLVFQLTHSASALGVVTAAYYLPYILFGLVIGALVDRVDPRRLMIAADAARAALVGSVPAAYAMGLLDAWWIYAVTFVSSTLTIAFNSASFAALPTLVPRKKHLVAANGRLQAGYSAASLVGPLVAGLVLLVVRAPMLLVADALSYVVSAASLLSIRTSLRSAERTEDRPALRRDIAEGLRYVLRNPVLRNLALMAALVNLFLVTTLAQIVLLAKERLSASGTGVALLFAAGSAGVVVLSLAAPWLRARVSFGRLAIGSMGANGLFTIVLAGTRELWVGAIAYGGVLGTLALFGISTASVRQSITPARMLGRVISIAMVLAWSVEPIGAVLGGVAIQHGLGVEAAYAIVGGALLVIAGAFAASPVGRSSWDGQTSKIVAPEV